MSENVLRIGIGGPVGSGKTALTEALVPRLFAAGRQPAVITNDIYTQEDAQHVRRELAGSSTRSGSWAWRRRVPAHRGARRPDDEPRRRRRDAREVPRGRHADLRVGGDNLTLTFSPSLADVFIFVLDTSEGEKMPASEVRASPSRTSS
ncbi:GTP-binding protein [Oerskovia sp. M15]